MRLSQPSERYLLMRQLCLIFGLGARDALLLFLGCKSASLWTQNGENGAPITWFTARHVIVESDISQKHLPPLVEDIKKEVFFVIIYSLYFNLRIYFIFYLMED